MKRYILAAAIFFLIVCPKDGGALTIDFEGLEDLSSIFNKYSSLGVEFSRATVITAGLSLNEFEFPPRSGQNVAFDDGGPMTLIFSQPVFSLGAYFTYSAPLSLSFFDALGNAKGAIQSAFSSNLALSGDTGSVPNELLSFSPGTGFSKVVISGTAAGSSFTMDDLTFMTSVPEPAAILLLGPVILGLAGYLWRLKKRSQS